MLRYLYSTIIKYTVVYKVKLRSKGGRFNVCFSSLRLNNIPDSSVRKHPLFWLKMRQNKRWHVAVNRCMPEQRAFTLEARGEAVFHQERASPRATD